MTEQQAIKLYETKFWEGMMPFDIAMFQLWEERLCMPFNLYHRSLEFVLGREVKSHELSAENRDALKEEFLGLMPTPSVEEIINLIPKDKRVIAEL